MEKYQYYFCPCSAHCQFGIIRCICLKMVCNLKMVCQIVEQIGIWDVKHLSMEIYQDYL